MHRHFTGQFLKVLLLGFLCCLGAEAKDDVPAKPKAPLLALKNVHPENDKLARQVKAGTKPTPPGYRLYSLPYLDWETNKNIGEKPILLKRASIVTDEGVKVARATGNPGEIAILLTEKAGKRMTNITERMNLGQDRLAIVLEGKCLIAPTVQAKLGRNFIIAGLSGKKEVDRIVFALNTPIKKASNK